MVADFVQSEDVYRLGEGEGESRGGRALGALDVGRGSARTHGLAPGAYFRTHGLELSAQQPHNILARTCS
jgi:hypothetical protein